MFRREVIKVSGLVAGSLLLCACAGQPGVGYGGSGGNAAKGGLGSGASAGIGSTDPMTAGTGSRIIFGTTACKTTCAAGECGPVSNGCGAFVECGGCTLPETCGGSGVPSHCGVPGNPVCKPTTCAALGATCGLQSDGCGGVLDCWSVEAKASGTAACPVSGEQCIDGTCKSTTPQCTKLTCTDYAATPDLCGPVSDGCGGTLDCGFKCSMDKVCGAVSPGKCGKVECEPLSCESVLAGKPAGFCGVVPDGCGGVIPNCATTCTNGDSCGGGGTPDVCGRGGAVCVPLTNAACGNACGSISDGCGGVVQCNTCSLPETCGGGGTPGVCGAPVCQARTCASVNAECGIYGDGNGCGGPLDCGNPCTSPETCGGGGIPNQCGAAVCVPLTKEQVCKPGMCGPQPDGCGTGMHECGGCTAPNTCGGGGTESVCGAPPCTKLTCAAVGANCGPISDGCNGIIESCGTCGTGQICGAVEPSKCGVAVDPNCTGLCQKIDWTCSSGSETRLTGTVFAPNGTLPLYNALVYVPNASLPSIKQGASCERCEDENLGKPIAAALTGPDGKFVLRNVPTGVEFPIVVKMGKWRRVVTIPAIARCTNVNLTAEQSRLPRNKNDATAANVGYLNIPKFAVATGAVDAIECVMRKIGVSDTEFTQPTGAGRVHMYRANGGVMGCSRADKISTSSSGVKTCTDSAYYVQNPLKDLFATTNGKTKLSEYDVAVLDCEGSANEHSNSYDEKLRLWANAGGRMFASHYSYVYLHDNEKFAETATWGGAQKGNGDKTTGIIEKGSPKGLALNGWLGNVGGWSKSYGDGYIDITDPREYVKAISASAERFIYTDKNKVVNGVNINQTSAVEQYAFNTPWQADKSNICGRVLYSAFHVAGASALGSKIFPTYCNTAALTPQEKVLAFMLFDLSACVSIGDPPKPPTCTARTCAQLGATCGKVADGCGGLLSCGECTAPLACGGGGVPNQCGNYCTRTTCGKKGANCGSIADGCGGTLDCGDCTEPAVCGGSGTPNVCGTPACTPRSCSDVGAECGAVSDGCGHTLQCGSCTAPEICGGGGLPNVCGTGACSPGTCGSAKCGLIGDGCGGTISCGVCPAEYACVAGVCTRSVCQVRTCADVEATCGFIGDGCGGVLDCGACTEPLVCGGGDKPSQCGGSCSPRTCVQVGATCGAISDGCGDIKQCGVCPEGQTCGGGGVANKCGAGSCTSRTCSSVGANCGSIGDGCGAVVDCGACPAGQACVANHCSTTGGCVPLTCSEQDTFCGPAADGCGGLLDCGSCPSGETCGGNGTPGVCGKSIML